METVDAQFVTVEIDAAKLWASTLEKPDTATEQMLVKHRVLPWHNQALVEECQPFDFTAHEPEKIQSGLHAFIRTMMYRMRADRGMGLAANQIGVMARILVIATRDYQQYMINPQIVSVSDETCEMEEGCLSFVAKKPFRVKKTRPQRVTVYFKRIDGSGETVELEGLPARVFFHEHDHLNGIRMIDSDNPEKVKYQIDRLRKHQR